MFKKHFQRLLLPLSDQPPPLNLSRVSLFSLREDPNRQSSHLGLQILLISMASEPNPDLPQETEDFIKETIDHTLGLPVSTKTLELKLQALEEAHAILQNQYFALHSQLKDKDGVIERARFEATTIAQALRKFVEENQKWAAECRRLQNECSKWEKEGLLYEHDREALMEFSNETDGRAKEFEIRYLDAEERFMKVTEELQLYKNECELHKGNKTRLMEELNLLKERISLPEKLRLQGGSDQNEVPRESRTTTEVLSPVGACVEEDDLLDSLVAWMVNKDGMTAKAHAFLEANSEVESCQKLLKIWDRLRPSSQKVIALAAEAKILQNDKEHLRINLTRAEEEVKVLFEENNVMDEENKRLLKLYKRERHHHGSGEKRSCSGSAKGNKRKSSPKICSSIDLMMDFDSPDSSRLPLSPLQHNSLM